MKLVLNLDDIPKTQSLYSIEEKTLINGKLYSKLLDSLPPELIDIIYSYLDLDKKITCFEAYDNEIIKQMRPYMNLWFPKNTKKNEIKYYKKK